MKKIKAWAIYFNGSDIESAGICNWDTEDQLEIFSTNGEAKQRLKEYLPKILDVKKGEFSIKKVEITYTP